MIIVDQFKKEHFITKLGLDLNTLEFCDCDLSNDTHVHVEMKEVGSGKLAKVPKEYTIKFFNLINESQGIYKEQIVSPCTDGLCGL